MRAKAVEERRSLLKQSKECKFVESHEFCELLIGFKSLVRADEVSVNLRGLLDPETGTRFFIEAEKLSPPATSW